jgi:hypothetical protein
VTDTKNEQEPLREASEKSRGYAGAMLRGSCLCGGVKYEAEGPITLIARCHCAQCRKASGAEFATNGNVAKAGFRVVAGEALLAEYESSPGNFRVFCGRCGSPMFARTEKHPEFVRVRLGCLDTEFDEKPLAHVFVGEKPKWSEICDALPQFETLPR